jgi:hypothetical protein
MNLKPVELQMAIPRATEVGRVQQQTQQKPQQDQTLLQQAAAKTSEINQQKTQNVDEANGERVRDEEKQKDSQSKKRKKHKLAGYQASTKKEEHDNNQAEHPFKGKRIDLSL